MAARPHAFGAMALGINLGPNGHLIVFNRVYGESLPHVCKCDNVTRP
jgi:hypothetical protein